MQLLTSNHKLELEGPGRYTVRGLSLAPHRLAGLRSVCQDADDCVLACRMLFSGRGVTSTVRQATIRRTRWYLTDRAHFLETLRRDLDRLATLPNPACRLNLGSDEDWVAIIGEYPNIQFWDYTKVRSRYRQWLDGNLPANYHLTFSRGSSTHQATLAAFLRRGGTVSVVLDLRHCRVHRDPLPPTIRIWGRDWPVIDGDAHDHRWTDPPGHVVGLRLTGTLRVRDLARRSNFVYHYPTGV